MVFVFSLLFSFVVVCTAAGAAGECAAWKGYSSVGVQAFVKKFANIKQGGFNMWSNTTTDSASYWNTFVALDAVFDAYSMGFLEEKFFQDFVSSLFETYMFQGWGSGYYDDEDWAIEALTKARGLVKNETVLSTLQQVLQGLAVHVRSGWDDSCCGQVKGGVWWDSSETYKASASNVGTVAAMCRMYHYTKKDEWLKFGKKVFDFWDAHFVAKDGQVCDGITTNGKYHWDVWSYNQGMYIESCSCLYNITGDISYLKKAEKVLDFILNNETIDGVISERSPCKYNNMDCLEFKGITYRFLSHYYENTKSASLRLFLQNNANAIMNNTYHGNEGQIIYPDDWSIKSDPNVAQSIAGQTSALAAILSWTKILCEIKN